MPPRFAYWTILIDNGPTAFRAREAQDLLPTLNQLKRKNPNAVMKWFSGGRLWDSPEDAWQARRRLAPRSDARGAQWRPGGAHADPRDRFRKKPDRFRTKTGTDQFRTKTGTDRFRKAQAPARPPRPPGRRPKKPR